MSASALLIGIGNPDRSDDGIGPAVVARLRDKVPSGVTVINHGGEMTSLLDHLESASAVMIIDAAASGAEPGSVHRFDAAVGALPEAVLALSTHGFGVAEAIEMARALGSLPPRCIVLAVEGASFEAGQGLSLAVAHALPEIAAQVLDELALLVEGSTAHA